MSARLAALWLLIACTIFWLCLSGGLSNYLQPWWRPVMAGVCALVILLALEALVRPPAGAENPPRISALALVPALLVALAAPSPLGAAMLDATNNASNLSARPVAAQAGSAAGGSAGAAAISYSPLSDSSNEISLEELSDRFNFGDFSELVAKPVTVAGFLSQQAAGPGAPQGVYLNRYKIYCCAADAISYNARLVLSGPAAAALATLPADTWVEVSARVAPDSQFLALEVSDFSLIEQPKVPYL